MQNYVVKHWITIIPHLFVPQPPSLTLRNRFLQNGLCGEVERSGAIPGGHAPREQTVPVSVLIIGQRTSTVVATVPKLAKRQRGCGALNVLPRVRAGIAERKVQTPAIEPIVLLQPLNFLGWGYTIISTRKK
jgi:hypothetical protein